MPDQAHFLGGGLSDTLLHPYVAIALVISLLLILLLPRKYVIVPALAFVFLAPLGQQVYALGVHWLVGRIIFLVALARLSAYAGEREWLAGRFNSVDYAFAMSILCEAAAFVLRYMSADALVNQLGFIIDFLAAYIVFRVVIRDERDIYRAIKVLAVLVCIAGVCMIRERMTGENIFGYLGGVRILSEIREGRIRSQGPFQHSLTAGTYAATLLPLFVLLWKHGRSRLMASFGVVGCTVMMYCANASTPLLTYAAGAAAICAWGLRKKLRNIRLGFVIGLIALQFVMKAPVWFLMARVDLTGSSSGYHRAELVDNFIRRFDDWWLMGKSDSANWGWDMWDQQNQFVQVGETGGLLAFIFYMVMVARTCARLGQARKLVEGTSKESFVWILGASLFATLVGFFGVNYFDQSKVGWLLLLAMISAATSQIFKSKITDQKPQPQPVIEEWGAPQMDVAALAGNQT